MTEYVSPEDRLAEAGAIEHPPSPPQPMAGARDFTFEFPDTLSTMSASWLVYGLLPAYGVGFLYGPTGVGKSFLAVDMACRLACGVSVLGQEPEEPAGVIYIAAEDPVGIRGRIAAWKLHHDRNDRFPVALVPQGPRFNDSESVAHLRQCLKKAASEMLATTGVAARLVIVDTLSSVSPGMRGNEDADATAQMAILRSLAADIGGVCLAVHHPGKNASLGMRGSYAYQADADFFFSMDPDGADVRTGLVTVGKMKNGAAGQTHAIRRSEPVEIARDDKGRPVTSCVVLPAELPRGRRTTSQLTPKQAELFKHIRSAMEAHGGVKYAPQLGYVTSVIGRPQLNDHLIGRGWLETEADGEGDGDGSRGALTSGARNRMHKHLSALRKLGLVSFDAVSVALTSTGETFEACHPKG